MFRFPFLIASLLLVYFHRNIHAQSTFSIDQDTVTIIDGFFLDHSPPLERYETVQITNDSQEDIEIKIDITESYNSHPSDLDFLASAGPGTWYLEDPEAILTVQAGASEYILFELRANSFDCIPKEFLYMISVNQILRSP